MASVLMTRTWPDGDKVAVQVGADTSYPDALDEARATCLRGFREAVEANETTWRIPAKDDET